MQFWRVILENKSWRDKNQSGSFIVRSSPTGLLPQWLRWDSSPSPPGYKQPSVAPLCPAEPVELLSVQPLPACTRPRWASCRPRTAYGSPPGHTPSKNMALWSVLRLSAAGQHFVSITCLSSTLSPTCILSIECSWSKEKKGHDICLGPVRWKHVCSENVFVCVCYVDTLFFQYKIFTLFTKFHLFLHWHYWRNFVFFTSTFHEIST